MVYPAPSSITTPASDPNFFTLETVAATGLNVVTVSATAKLWPALAIGEVAAGDGLIPGRLQPMGIIW